MEIDEYLEEIVTRTITNTSLLLAEGGLSWPVAKQGMEKIRVDLSNKWPEHEFWIRSQFETWIRARERG